MIKREDDFATRHEHLKDLSDAELEQRFWDLLGQIVDPMLNLARENTTPAIERSVLLRMGFSSLEAKAIVDGCVERSLLGHGAGNVVYRLSKARGVEVREAGLLLVNGKAWEEAEKLFGEVA